MSADTTWIPLFVVFPVDPPACSLAYTLPTRWLTHQLTRRLVSLPNVDRSPSESGRGRVTRSDSTRNSMRQVNNMKENSAMTSAMWKEGSSVAFSSQSMAESYGRQGPPAFVDSLELDMCKEVVQMVDCVNMGATTRAIILAGGEQKNPLTQYRAMPAVPIGSCMMLIDVPINNCLGAGINKMYVLTQFQSHQINSHIASAYPPQGFGHTSGWVDVLAAQQTVSAKEWYKGSADAIRRNLMELKDEARGVEPAEDYVIMSGSAMYNMDIARVVGFHRMKKADITICSLQMSADEAQTKGVVIGDEVGRVSGFHEKPGTRVSDLLNGDNKALVSMGVYVIKRDVMLRLLEDDDSSPMGGRPMEHIGHHMIPAALETGARVFTYEHDGYWKDVSTLRDYYEANIALTSKSKTPIKFFELELAISAKKGKMLPPAKMCGHVDIEESILGDGAILSDGCVSRRSIIGENVLVGPGTVIEDSLLLGSPVWTSESQREAAKARGDLIFGVGRNSQLRGCVVDENAYIGDGCIVRNDAGLMEADRSSEGYMIEDGLIVVLKNAFIPDGTVI